MEEITDMKSQLEAQHQKYAEILEQEKERMRVSTVANSGRQFNKIRVGAKGK